MKVTQPMIERGLTALRELSPTADQREEVESILRAALNDPKVAAAPMPGQMAVEDFVTYG